FPGATVHISAEEHARLGSGHWRYLPVHFVHGPRWETHAASAGRWFGLEARPLDLGIDADVRLVPLFGHTLGHCGVAVGVGGRWMLHVGDAYYLRPELFTDDHPVSSLASARADDNDRRVAGLAELRRLVRDHGDEVELFGYHDFDEFPPG
ncbi:MBL fold metallo-hydrolase, partial [bacterium]|nr:MBL fold metallo-hydrolase [bacterium]